MIRRLSIVAMVCLLLTHSVWAQTDVVQARLDWASTVDDGSNTVLMQFGDPSEVVRLLRLMHPNVTCEVVTRPGLVLLQGPDQDVRDILSTMITWQNDCHQEVVRIALRRRRGQHRIIFEPWATGVVLTAERHQQPEQIAERLKALFPDMDVNVVPGQNLVFFKGFWIDVRLARLVI